MKTHPPSNRRAKRACTARLATLVSLLASSLFLVAPAASAQEAGAITANLGVSPDSRPEPGGGFVFALQVTNTGDEDVTIDSLTDDVYGDLAARSDSCAALIGDVLQPAETATCLYTGAFTGVDGDEQTNTVTVTGTTEGAAEVTDSASATVVITAAVDDGDDDDADTSVAVEYAVSPSSRPEPGGAFQFGVRVTNTGDEEVELITLRDSVYGDLEDEVGNCETGVMLDPDEQYTCSFVAEFTGDDGDTQTNTVTATVEDDDGDEASDTDSVEIRITEESDAVPGGDTGGDTTIIVNNSSSSSSSAAAAAGGGGQPTPSPSPTPTVKVKELVRTGQDSLPMGAGGLSLLVLGSLLVVTAERERRRRLYSEGRA